MHLTGTLPKPALAKLGNKYVVSTNSAYTMLQTFEGGIVYRTAAQRLIISYASGEVFDFSNQCSAVFENNTYVSPSGLLLWLYKEGDRLFLGVFNLLTKAIVRNLYITTDAGFPSIAVDSFLNRVIIYKSYPANGTFDHSYIYTYTFTTNELLAFHDDFGTSPVNSVIHLAFKKNSTGFYRSIQNLTLGFTKIDYIFHGTLDNQLYYENPAGGATLVQDSNSIDIWYPHFVDSLDLIVVYSQDMSQISAWDTTTVNTQAVSPSLFDNRVNLFHAQYDKIGYPRLYQYNDTIFDQRILTSFDTIGALTLEAEYDICINNVVAPAYPLLLTNDRQSAFVISNSTKKATIGLQPYFLDDKNACDLEVYGVVKDATFVEATNPDLSVNTGLITNVTPLTSSDILLYADRDIIVTVNGFLLTFTNQSATTTITTFSTTPLAFVRVLNKLYIKDSTDFYIVDVLTTNVDLNVSEVVGTVIEAFCWNSKVYFRTNSHILIYNLSSLSYTNTAVAYSRSGKVRLIPNKFNGQLYLYDREIPASIFTVSINLTTEDYTSTSFLRTLVDNNLPGGLRGSFDDFQFYCSWVNETDIFFMDTFNGNASILQNFRNINDSTGFPIQVINRRAAGSDVWVFNDLIFSLHYKGIFKFSSSFLTTISYTMLLIEQPSMTVLGANTGQPGAVTNQQVMFASNNTGELTLYLNGYSNSDPGVFEYTFTTIGLRKGALVNNLNGDHVFFVNYYGSQLVVPIPNILNEGYSKERVLDPEVIFSNSLSKIDKNSRQFIKYKYSIQFLNVEQAASFFVNIYNDQELQLSGFELYHADNYRPQEFTGNQGVIERIVITDVKWEWFSKDLYLTSVQFETFSTLFNIV